MGLKEKNISPFTKIENANFKNKPRTASIKNIQDNYF